MTAKQPKKRTKFDYDALDQLISKGEVTGEGSGT
jgi:YD repeat-containing protein